MNDEKNIVNIQMNQDDVASAQIELLIKIQASIAALFTVVLPEITRDKAHALELAKKYEADIEKFVRLYRSDFQAKHSWSEFLDAPD